MFWKAHLSDTLLTFTLQEFDNRHSLSVGILTTQGSKMPCIVFKLEKRTRGEGKGILLLDLNVSSGQGDSSLPPHPSVIFDQSSLKGIKPLHAISHENWN